MYEQDRNDNNNENDYSMSFDDGDLRDTHRGK